MSTALLIALDPTLVAQWHPSLNGDLTPVQVGARNARKVWWRCEHGHEWQAQINKRTDGSRCPFCTGRRVKPGVTDLSTVNPDLAAQWHPSRNGELTTSMVSAGSNTKVWWRCERQHQWQSRVVDRAVMGRGCPFCSGARPSGERTDLATANPDVAALWHPTFNDALTPADVSPGSHRAVWWLCANGHSSRAPVRNRSAGKGCPQCLGRPAHDPVTTKSLTEVDTEIAAQWHPTRNADLTPTQVDVGSSRVVWWRCEAGHEWEQSVVDRVFGPGCWQCRRSSRLTAQVSHE